MSTEQAIARAALVLESQEAGLGAKWLLDCALLAAGDEFECPACDHECAYHDGIRRCHVGWLPGAVAGPAACRCGRTLADYQARIAAGHTTQPEEVFTR